MKTNNLSKKSLLTTMILALSSIFHSSKHVPAASMPNGYVGGGSPIFIPRRCKFKGHMREKRRTDRGHGYNKKRAA